MMMTARPRLDKMKEHPAPATRWREKVALGKVA